jgi:subtilisin family serine protease/subtilisin-like proprotein convertase family protein
MINSLSRNTLDGSARRARKGSVPHAASPTLTGWLLASLAACLPLAAETALIHFREPAWTAHEWRAPENNSRPAAADDWIALPRAGTSSLVTFGSKVLLKLSPGTDLEPLLEGSLLTVERRWGGTGFTLRAPDARVALAEAARLALAPGVEVSHPVRRRPIQLHGRYAPAPSDPSFSQAWHLEQRDALTGQAVGTDLNARAAWPWSRGSGVVVALADDGLDLAHPDLADRVTGMPHFNFLDDTTNGSHPAASLAHGTAVSGLIAASGDNRQGALGVAPQASLAGWVIFGAAGSFADEEQVARMFEYALDRVAVQNHSWGNAGTEQLPLSAVESAGIEAAVTKGRGGKGVVLVRAAGNERTGLNNANDDAYANDPRVITVGAVRNNGRATSYSTPGACLLVAAPSGDSAVEMPGGVTNFPALFTTDRRATLGYNRVATASGGDYGSGPTGFSGTSGSAPQVAGVVALMLAVNPDLAVRDVQQALLLSARQTDPADPAIRTNGAGLRVSHNTGYGVPDAGLAVRLARSWSNRPAPVQISVTNTSGGNIPDDGLRVVVTGGRVPAGLESIPANPSDAPHPDDPTDLLELVDLGQALQPITSDLRGRGALIQRGGNFFAEKIRFAAEAGAGYAVIWNNTGSSERVYMNGADIQFSAIPAVFISQNQGQALREFVEQSPGTRARLELKTLALSLPVTNTLSCEHVRLRVVMDHRRRGDVRITLISPSGTRGVLHQYNNDTFGSLTEWDFYSVQHFFEPTAGLWRVEFSDERQGVVGRVNRVELQLTGVPITDSDSDGLDDLWEARWFGSLALRATDDPDRDGWNNASEQVLGRDPSAPDEPLELDLARWNNRLTRLSFPSSAAFRYELLSWGSLSGPATLLTNLVGRFPETEVFVPVPGTNRFFNVRQLEP